MVVRRRILRLIRWQMLPLERWRSRLADEIPDAVEHVPIWILQTFPADTPGDGEDEYVDDDDLDTDRTRWRPES